MYEPISNTYIAFKDKERPAKANFKPAELCALIGRYSVPTVLHDVAKSDSALNNTVNN